MDSQRVEEEEVLSASQYDVQTEEEWTIISSADTSEDHSQETSDTLDIIGIGNDNETNEVRTNEENMTGKGKVKESGSDISNENESKSENEKKVMDENNDNENKENLNTDNIQELKEAKLRVKDDETLSDIDIIEDETSADDEEEDDLSESASMCSSSVISQMSSLSFLRDPYLKAKLNPDYIPEDVSDISSLVYRRHDGDEDVRAVLELKPGVRAYVHTPNTQLNVRLNLLLALAVTAVLGLGVGNFLGWSTHKNSKQLSLSQVMNLKQLQDELIDCMDHQTPSFKHNGVRNTNNVCYGNSVYWKEKFEKLFSENGGLMELLEKTQKHYHLKGNHDNILSDKDCVNATASEEFHNLKLGMLVKQMEHLHLLKTLEEIKLKQEQSTKRVNVLETENSELKMKLIEEEEDDKQMEESWGSKVAELEDENEKLRVRLVEEDIEDEKEAIMMNELQGTIGELQEENMELKGALGQLEAQIERAGHHHHSNMKDLNKVDYSVRPSSSETNTHNSVPVKLDQLRQRINQMMSENDELKTTIARLRWSSQVNQEIVTIEDEEEEQGEESYEEDISVVNLVFEDQLNNLREMLDAEQKESQKWKKLYEESKLRSENKKKTGKIDETQFEDWINNFTEMLKTGLTSGSIVLGEQLQHIWNQFSQGNTILSTEIFKGLNATQHMITELNERLKSKWEELQFAKDDINDGSQKLTNKMAKLLENTLRKLKEAGEKFSNNGNTFESRMKYFSASLNKIGKHLENKWSELQTKWTRRTTRSRNQKSATTHNNNPNEAPSDASWVFERASARRAKGEVDKGNWLFERAKEREAQRVATNVDKKSNDDVNWFLKRDKRKARFKRSVNQLDESAEDDSSEEDHLIHNHYDQRSYQRR